jgi:hypothetical protein
LVNENHEEEENTLLCFIEGEKERERGGGLKGMWFAQLGLLKTAPNDIYMYIYDVDYKIRLQWGRRRMYCRD